MNHIMQFSNKNISQQQHLSWKVYLKYVGIRCFPLTDNSCSIRPHIWQTKNSEGPKIRIFLAQKEKPKYKKS
jgi:hypothetical protein